MKYNLIVNRAAMLDAMDAYNYYEDIRPGLGEYFVECLEARYSTLSQNPDLYSFSDDANIIRDVLVTGFPYLIIYEVAGADVVILAIHNTYKKPFSRP